MEREGAAFAAELERMDALVAERDAVLDPYRRFRSRIEAVLGGLLRVYVSRGGA